MIRSVATLLATVSHIHPWGLHHSVYTHAAWVQGQGLLTQLHLTVWPSPPFIAEAGARAPKTFITTPMLGTVASWGEGQVLTQAKGSGAG